MVGQNPVCDPLKIFSAPSAPRPPNNKGGGGQKPNGGKTQRTLLIQNKYIINNKNIIVLSMDSTLLKTLGSPGRWGERAINAPGAGYIAVAGSATGQ